MHACRLARGFIIFHRIFFFSSRRRHTRWTGDWSSDVCSSDLDLAASGVHVLDHEPDGSPPDPGVTATAHGARQVEEIGRASCRERVKIGGVGGSLKKKLGTGGG